jgi:nitrite reductase/ring-hydroxylating ferredoxin subunit
MGTEAGAAQPFRFCAVDELLPGRVRSAMLGGRPVAVVRGEDGALSAFGALCPHQHADLAHGLLEDGGITCPDHLWHFELPSGRCTSIPGAQLPLFPVREEAGEIIVDVVPR